MEEKVYRTKIDLRVLGDEIKFVFFMSGNVNSAMYRFVKVLYY